MSNSSFFGESPSLPAILYPNYFPDAIASTTSSLASNASGTYVFITNTGSAYNISLPSPAPNVMFNFIVKGTLNAAVTIKAPSAVVYGSLLSSDGTAVTGGAITSAKTNVILGTTATLGDNYFFWSDGTNWYVNGITAVHGSVTSS